ncbi:hypothetical protein HOE22_09900 [Candidatus Woesearchaeota archaeon]|jgi:hypothetical protein|nr:hypothetical protein [Candidatus Woesearchaeota archaeon]MBT4731290.1 hypothetical protein [Candidatus Woesearchaeota archaeon]MBT7558452.1 hypothetical protein [Candidatus Woesearchaeota archaeon]
MEIGKYVGERVVDTCPVCYDRDTCFEDMYENYSSFLCFNCGMLSNTFYTEDNKERAKLLETTSKLVKDLEFFDEERQIYWYPSIINMGQMGMIFPEGSINKWVWKYATVVEVPKNEKESYPVPGKDGEFYTEKLDMEGAIEYGQYEFLQACKDMGFAKDIGNG